MVTDTKVCKGCGENKPADEYYRVKGRWLYSRCKGCHLVRTNAWRRANPARAREIYHKCAFKRRHIRSEQKRQKGTGCTADQYSEMMERQGGRCAICRGTGITIKRCGRPRVDGRPQNKVTLPLAVDHDHVTGAIRGLLCHHCNLGLGNLKADEGIILLERATAYIANASAKQEASHGA